MSHPPAIISAMSTLTPHPPIRRAHTIPAGAHLRRHRSDVARWALASGSILRRDALAAIVAARAVSPVGPLPDRWTAEDVADLLCSDVPQWCAEHGVAPPPELAATLATYLRYLSAHRLLGPGSDNMGTLRRSIAEHRLGDRESRTSHPAGTRGAPVLPIS